jgi:hypothetical protein
MSTDGQILIYSVVFGGSRYGDRSSGGGSSNSSSSSSSSSGSSGGSSSSGSMYSRFKKVSKTS